MTKPKCIECVFFQPLNRYSCDPEDWEAGLNKRGECRRYPKTTFEEYPIVHQTNDWCGEFGTLSELNDGTTT